MSDSTVQTYKVETVYEVVDKTSRKVDEIGKSMRETARATESLGTMIKTVGAAFIGGAIFHKAKASLIDYNAELENSRTVIAGMLSMYTGASIDKSWERASISVERFQKMAAKSALTTKELVETAAAVTRPLIQQGVSVTQIEKITFGVANAAKAMGMNTAVVAMDIEQAMQGRVGQRDRFMRSMLAQKEVGYSDFKKFNALSSEKRVEVLEKALNSKAVSAMAEKQSQTWSGVMSTLEDNFQIALGKVGLPLFKAITNEVKGWNEWLDKNSVKVDQFGKQVASGLVKAFGYVKDVFVFLYNHADTLIALAKAYAAIKITDKLVGGLGSTVGGIAGKGSGIMGFLRGARDSYDSEGNYQYTPAGRGRQAVGGFGGAMQNFSLLSQSLAVGVGIGTLLTDLTGMKHAFGAVAEVNGKLYDVTDSTTDKYVQLLRQMGNFDQALADSARAMNGQTGAKATVNATNLAGLANFADKQAEFIKDTMREYGAEDKLWSSQMMAGLLKNSGLFDDQELAKTIKNPQQMYEKYAEEATQYAARQQSAVTTADQAWNSIPESVRKTLDQQQVTNQLVSQALKAMPMDKGKFAPTIILDKTAIDAAIKLATGVDPQDKGFQGTPPKQTVNITIQRVMAKDPNKWLAEMDDMVNRRTRAPTRAKGSWKNTHH